MATKPSQLERTIIAGVDRRHSWLTREFIRRHDDIQHRLACGTSMPVLVADLAKTTRHKPVARQTAWRSWAIAVDIIAVARGSKTHRDGSKPHRRQPMPVAPAVPGHQRPPAATTRVTVPHSSKRFTQDDC